MATKSFKASAYYFNRGDLIEVQLDHTGEMARYKITQSYTAPDTAVVFYGRWQEIQHNRAGVPFIRNWSNYHKTKRHTRLYFYDFMVTGQRPANIPYLENITAERRYKKNAEQFEHELENLLLIHGYHAGCFKRFFESIKADIKPNQKSKLKDFNRWINEL